MPVLKGDTPAQAAGKKRASAGATDAQLDMPIEKLLGKPVCYRVGPLTLSIQALPAGRTADFAARLLMIWPDVLFHAAIGDQKLARTIDYERIARDMSARRTQETPEGEEAPEPLSAESIMLAVTEVGYTLSDPATRYAMADLLYEVCKETPGVAWPRPTEGEAAPPGLRWFDEFLFDTLIGEEMVYLTRALFLGIGGFPGDAADRFTRR